MNLTVWLWVIGKYKTPKLTPLLSMLLPGGRDLDNRLAQITPSMPSNGSRSLTSHISSGGSLICCSRSPRSLNDALQRSHEKSEGRLCFKTTCCLGKLAPRFQKDVHCNSRFLSHLTAAILGKNVMEQE